MLIQKLRALVSEFATCWEEKGPIDIPEEERMPVPLVEGWQNQKVATRCYPLGIKDREAVDKVFDELAKEGSTTDLEDKVGHQPRGEPRICWYL
jgi:hypothetical protein